MRVFLWILIISYQSLFDLLKVGILDVVILWSTLLLSLLLTSKGVVLRTGLSALCALIHLLRGSLPSSIKGVDSVVDGSNVTRFVGILQLLQSLFDSGLVLSRNLVANLVQLVLRLEDHRVSLIQLVYTLTLTLVVLGILLSLGLHAVDLVL